MWVKTADKTKCQPTHLSSSCFEPTHIISLYTQATVFDNVEQRHHSGGVQVAEVHIICPVVECHGLSMSSSKSFHLPPRPGHITYCITVRLISKDTLTTPLNNDETSCSVSLLLVCASAHASSCTCHETNSVPPTFPGFIGYFFKISPQPIRTKSVLQCMAEPQLTSCSTKSDRFEVLPPLSECLLWAN